MAGPSSPTTPSSPFDDSAAVVQSMLTGFAAGGAAGGSWGALLAVVRGEPVAFYAASVGANVAVVSAAYVTFHEIIAKRRGKRDLTSYVLPGTITGGGLLGLVGSPIRAVQGAAAGSALGAGVFFGLKYFDEWRQATAIERYIAKYGPDAIHDLPSHAAASSTPFQAPAISSIGLQGLIPSFVDIPEDEIEARIQARLQQLLQDDIATKTGPE
ncbi:hypothetical protein H310_06785 [Aphanomyces invadans]|uniref:Uncharacterized protein n=1 Tax=Aphanomyces invadans TaxID=157072 RepID=A0A024U6E2_9STRA|nr:hypothetical protein H310_06785 [Aphanomyces invadans]ETW01188.1 hypothetical protein H310_06785 [Aphanomyces invadans]|eukprot:XP_008870186.1 hypothetical protein H310_06785 [Aphanomyces invadans]